MTPVKKIQDLLDRWMEEAVAQDHERDDWRDLYGSVDFSLETGDVRFALAYRFPSGVVVWAWYATDETSRFSEKAIKNGVRDGLNRLWEARELSALAEMVESEEMA